MAIGTNDGRLGVINNGDVAPQRRLMAGFAQVGCPGMVPRLARPLLVVVTGKTNPRGLFELSKQMALPALNYTVTARQWISGGYVVERGPGKLGERGNTTGQHHDPRYGNAQSNRMQTTHQGFSIVAVPAQPGLRLSKSTQNSPTMRLGLPPKTDATPLACATQRLLTAIRRISAGLNIPANGLREIRNPDFCFCTSLLSHGKQHSSAPSDSEAAPLNLTRPN